MQKTALYVGDIYKRIAGNDNSFGECFKKRCTVNHCYKANKYPHQITNL